MGRLLAHCENVMTYLAIASTFILMCLTSADALGRYVFNRPIAGAYEITEKYLMTMTIFLGFSYAYRQGFLIRVTFLSDRFRGRVRLLSAYFAQLVSILYGCLLVLTTLKRAIQTIASGTLLGNVPIPLWPAYVVVPVGLFFMTILLILDLRHVKAGKSRLFVEESPTV
jgi:TRAP-type C4-dicarboxylate transport system permease small subunit